MEFKENLTLYRAFVNAAEQVPNETAIFYYNNKISFHRLLHYVDRWASILQNDLNIKKGDSVLIALPNIPQTLIIFYAVNKIGGICNMVHPYTPEERLQKYYNESNCKVAFLFDRRVNKELKAYKTFEGNIIICEPQTHFAAIKSRWIYDLFNAPIRNALKTNSKFSFYHDFKENNEEAVEIP